MVSPVHGTGDSAAPLQYVLNGPAAAGPTVTGLSANRSATRPGSASAGRENSGDLGKDISANAAAHQRSASVSSAIHNKEFHINSADLDQLEQAEATPRTVLGSDPLSPKLCFRRTSGRRPLSIVSSSSLNSDLSPPMDHPSPDPLSPGRHRRHRSVLGAAIDYRTQQYPQHHPYNSYQQLYYQPQSQQFPYHYQQQQLQQQQQFQQQQIQLQIQQQIQQQQQFNHPPPSPNDSHSSFSTPFLSQDGFSQIPLYYDQPPHVYPPHSSPPMDLPTPAAAAQALLDTASNGIQEVLVALAYKERQVLEAKQTWQAAKDDLATFRRQLDAMLAPVPEPVRIPSKASIISRRHQPNLGLHALQYAPSRHSTPRRFRPRVVSWKIDNEVPAPQQPANMDEMSEDTIYTPELQPSFARKIANCLVGIVNCIITTFPVHQRDFRYELRVIYWHPEYPMPFDSLFSHLIDDPFAQ